MQYESVTCTSFSGVDIKVITASHLKSYPTDMHVQLLPENMAEVVFTYPLLSNSKPPKVGSRIASIDIMAANECGHAVQLLNIVDAKVEEVSFSIYADDIVLNYKVKIIGCYDQAHTFVKIDFDHEHTISESLLSYLTRRKTNAV